VSSSPTDRKKTKPLKLICTSNEQTNSGKQKRKTLKLICNSNKQNKQTNRGKNQFEHWNFFKNKMSTTNRKKEKL
jgi:hypothetical protein